MNKRRRQLESRLRHMKPQPLSTSVEQQIELRMQKVERSSRWRKMMPVLLGTAACIIIAVTVIWSIKQNQPENPPIARPAPDEDKKPDTNKKKDPPTDQPNSSPEPEPAQTVIALAERWTVEPTGDAQFKVVDPHRIRLDYGEIYLTSIETDDHANDASDSAQDLIVETPSGNAHAQGGSFYVGAHPLGKSETDPETAKGNVMRGMTRVLVLAGTVALSNMLGSVDGGQNELLAAETDKAPVKQVVTANSDFGFDLYRQLAKENNGKNIFISPYSVTTALSMALEGARTETAAEMGKMLRLPKEARRVGDDAQLIPWRTSLMHSGLAELQGRFNAKDKKYELSVANAMWGEKTYPFRKEFTSTIDKFYDSGALRLVDFIGSPNAERKIINKWVEDQTNDRIKDLLPEGSVTVDTRMVLANAIYFKGDWKAQFKKANTRDGGFTTADGKKVKAPLMYQAFGKEARYMAINVDGTPFKTPKMTGRGKPLYPKGDGFLMVELPYAGDDLSMVLIAPQKVDGIAALEKQLTSANLATWTSKLEEREVTVRMPKFKMETNYALTDTLPKLGMVKAFQNGKADFRGLDNSRRLFVTDVFHKAFVEVNEEGTEAAAATAVVIGLESAIPVEPFTPYFNADRPFVFVIRDVKSGAALFVGRVTNPVE